MSVQPTETPGLADQAVPIPEPPSPAELTPQRHGYMAVLAAAETIMSTSPVLPESVQVYCQPWDISGARVQLHFHQAPDELRTFAAHFGAVVTEFVHPDGAPLTEARGLVGDVPFRAWTLMPAPDPVPVARKQAPAADCPAARLAAALRDSQPDVVLAEVIDDTLLRLHVRPQSLDGWRWWLDHLTANVGSITHKGAYATCRGELDGVRVLMAGFGVGDLQAAARRDAEAGERA